jgi:hydroxyacylglutathione hydrolase
MTRHTEPPTPGRRLRVRTFTLGPFETNCYLLWTAAGDGPSGEPPEAWIIDAGFDPQPIIRAVRELGLRATWLILTHTHADHLAGVDEVLAAIPGLKTGVHALESSWLHDPVLNLSAMTGMPTTALGGRSPDRQFEGGEQLTLGPLAWSVLHTPGHSPGGLSLYCPSAGVVLSGDALFRGSIGRTDFPGSDPRLLEQSIRQKLYSLPDQTTVLAGHGPPTTIGQERRHNPFVHD